MSQQKQKHQQSTKPLSNPIDAVGQLWNRSNAQIQSVIKELNGPDIQREGTITHPLTREPINLENQLQKGRSNPNGLAGQLMGDLAFHPTQGPQVDPNLIRFFVPGLNTQEPEASDRTQYYAEALKQSMLHIHNGSHETAQLGDFNSQNLDYIVSGLGRLGLRNPPLLHKIETLLEANFSQAEPQDIHAILYSDSTIHGLNAIKSFREKEIKRRVNRYPFHMQMFMVSKVAQEVDDLLHKHVFVELHGNAVSELPQGPKYLVWTDKRDPLNHKNVPVLGSIGLNADNKAKNPDAAYIDYSGPYAGFDAHNIQAYGVHFVKATLDANGVSSPQELYDLIKAGTPIVIPTDVQGDESKLWNKPAALQK